MRKLILLGLTVLLAAIAVAGPVSAGKPVAPNTSDITDYYWDGTWQGGGWIDLACSDANWKIVLFQDVNFSGRHVAICSWTGDFCHVPFYDLGQSNPCDSHQHLWNDQASSVKVVNNTSGKCITLYADVWYNGLTGASHDHTRFGPGLTSIAALPNPAGSDVGYDEASSVKVTDPTSCP